ncbi:MAG TPA: GNAT family N-acetyltransferase [Candidatus Saccharimonadales bacterium]
MTEHERRTTLVDEATLEQVEALAKELFGGMMNLDEPIKGMNDDDIVAPDFHRMLRDPDNTLATLSEEDKVVGFALATPIGKMNPRRVAESADTAYVYIGGIVPDRQGEGLIRHVSKDIAGKLRDQGYTFAEADCVHSGGYAAKVHKALGGAIVKWEDHPGWPETGPERFFKIDLRQT